MEQSAGIKLEAYMYLESLDDKIVLTQDLFLGEVEAPSLTQTKTLEEVLSDFIDANSIPGGTVRPEHREHMMAALQQMEGEIQKAMKKVDQMPNWETSIHKEKMGKKKIKPNR